MKSKFGLVIFLVIGLIFSCNKVDFEASQRNSFVKFFGSQFFNSANDIIEVNGSYFLVGFSYQNESQMSGMLVKTNEFGNTDWEIFLPSAVGDIEINGITLGNDYTLVICGEIADTTGNSDIIVAKYTLDGALIWQNSFGGIENQKANQIVSANDGGYILVGTTTLANAGNTNPAGEEDVFVVKIDELGDSVASSQFGGGARDTGYDIIQYQSNQYVVLGTTESFDNAYDPSHENKLVYIIRLSNQLIENDALTHGDDQNQTGNSLSIDNNGNIIVSGSYQQLGGNKQGMLINLEYNNLRNILTNNPILYSSNGNEEFFDAEQQSNGTICATGISTVAGVDKISVFSINPDFSENTNFDLGYEGGAFGRNIIATSNGGFLIAGSSIFETNAKAILLKINENVEL